jgi:hypothetical protein
MRRPSVDPAAPDPVAIAAAATVLCAGGLVAFPTETVYGLGADALDPAAVRRICEAKGRPAFNPIIVHVAGSERQGDRPVRSHSGRAPPPRGTGMDGSARSPAPRGAMSSTHGR